MSDEREDSYDAAMRKQLAEWAEVIEIAESKGVRFKDTARSIRWAFSRIKQLEQSQRAPDCVWVRWNHVEIYRPCSGTVNDEMEKYCPDCGGKVVQQPEGSTDE